MPKIKILVCYHKKAPLFKNEVMVPIHAGRACGLEASKDGDLPKEEYDWLCNNMIGDDTGGEQNNLSHLNRDINEWSVIYWAFKNYDKLGNPDYIGLIHYRRLFDFRNIVKTGKCSYADALGLKQKYLSKILAKYDFVYRKGFKIKNTSLHTFECYQPQAKLSETYHPLLYKEYQKFKLEQVFYYNHIFIMKREDFFSFCNECVPLMMDILSMSKSERMETYMKWLKDNCPQDMYERFYRRYQIHGNYVNRYVSALMEYISCFYFMYLRDKYKERAYEANILMTEPPKFIALYKHRLIKVIIKLIVDKRRYKKFKRHTAAFFKDSKSSFVKLLGMLYFKY